MKPPPAWARDVVVNIDPEFLAADTVDRLLNARRAWGALPHDKARLAILRTVFWVNAIFGRDPDKYPAPAQTKANVKLAAKQLRMAAATIARIPEGTMWHLGVPSDLASKIKMHAMRLEHHVRLAPVPKHADRYNLLLHLLSQNLKIETGRYLDEVAAELANAFLAPPKPINADAVKKARKRQKTSPQLRAHLAAWPADTGDKTPAK